MRSTLVRVPPRNIILAVFAALSLAPSAHGAWKAQTSGVLTDLHSIHFTGTSTGIVVGNSGVILKSVDGGEVWSSVSSSTSNALRGVHFANASTGAAVGSDGTVLISTNGGNSWSPGISGAGGFILYDVFWVDASTAFAVGEIGRIRKTTNGGSVWLSGAPGGSTANDLKSVYFVNGSTGWACGDAGTVLRTFDGGANWTDKSSLIPTANLKSVFFINESTGFVVGESGAIYKSTDSGVTWNAKVTTTTTFNAVQFTSTSTGWAVGNSGAIFKSTTTGELWDSEKSTQTSNLADVFVLSKTLVFAVGASGTILKNEIATTVSATVEVPQGMLKAIDNLFDPARGESTTVQFNLNNSGPVSLKIYTLQGRLIRTVYNDIVTGGTTYNVQWDGKNDNGEMVASGIYLARIEGPQFVKNQKIAVVR